MITPNYEAENDSSHRKFNKAVYDENYERIFRRHRFHGISPADLDEQRIGSVDRETGRRYLGAGASEHIVHQQP